MPEGEVNASEFHIESETKMTEEGTGPDDHEVNRVQHERGSSTQRRTPSPKKHLPLAGSKFVLPACILCAFFPVVSAVRDNGSMAASTSAVAAAATATAAVAGVAAVARRRKQKSNSTVISNQGC